MGAVQPSVVDEATGTRYLASFGARLTAFAVDGLLAAASTLPGLIILILSPTQRQGCTIERAMG